AATASCTAQTAATSGLRHSARAPPPCRTHRLPPCQTRLAAPRAAAPLRGACQVADECTEEFGTCDHRCRSTPTGPACSCLPGYLPDGKDGRRCRAVGAAKLLYSTQAGVRLLDSDTEGLTKLKLVKFLDFDSSRRLVFFHTATRQVGRLRLDRPAAPAEILMRDAVLDAIGLRLDPRACCSTWVPDAADARNNSGGVGVLLNVDHGRGLAADPARGLLYISLWCGARPGLYTLAHGRLRAAPAADWRPGAPDRLALDSEQGRLYWLDMELRGVFFRQAQRRAIWHMGSGYDGIPLGLAQFEDRLLWSDLRAGAVYSIDKFAGQPLKLVLPPEHSGSVLSAVVYHSVRQAL
uniref:EGF-like domain-containing protein n=1 Tax=Macrostomum lignano TaxID=282301 RepID=A0A1I8FEH3_9PLAT